MILVKMHKFNEKICHSSTHEENRKRNCLLCLCSIESLIPIKGKLNDKVESIVNFKIDETTPTIVICTSCYRKVYRNKSEKHNFVLPDYTKFIFRKTRSNNDIQCTCYLCTLVRSRKSKIRKKTKRNVKNSVEKRCKRCFSVIARGVSHTCSKQKYKNVEEIVYNNLSNKEEDHVVASALKNKIETGEEQSKGQNNIVLLSQEKVAPLRVAVKPQEKNQSETICISVNKVAEFQNNYNFSFRKSKGVLSSIRKMTRNRKIFESNVVEKLIELNHTLDNYFKVEKCEFIRSKAKCETTVTEFLVYCHSVKDLINYVKKQRQLTDFDLKIGMDGGGGFLKIWLSVQSSTNITNKKIISEGNKTVCNKKVFKDSSVKKIFLQAVALITQENYYNVNLLWQKLELSELIKDYGTTISTDLKLANLMCGLMAHSSKFPRTWCIADSNSLHTKGIHRTVGQMIENYNEYVEVGCKTKLAKNYKNCVHLPVFHENSDKDILQLIPPPELHLMLGSVNTMVNHMLQNKLCKVDTNQWIKDCGVQREVTSNGSAFTGNSCQTLLNKIDLLRSQRSIVS